jgi:hypothetical protein
MQDEELRQSAPQSVLPRVTLLPPLMHRNASLADLKNSYCYREPGADTFDANYAEWIVAQSEMSTDKLDRLSPRARYDYHVKSEFWTRKAYNRALWRRCMGVRIHVMKRSELSILTRNVIEAIPPFLFQAAVEQSAFLESADDYHAMRAIAMWQIDRQRHSLGLHTVEENELNTM